MERRLTSLLISMVLAVSLFGYGPAGPLNAVEPIRQEEEQPLRVVTKPIEPFVIKDGDRLTGFSIDLWKEIALLTETPFEFVEVETVAEQLEMVANGEADVAIAAISMTPERETQIDFSYPYFKSGLQIMTKSRQAGTTSANYLRAEGIPFRGVDVIDEAYALLKNDQVDAIVYDAPVLQYYAATAGDGTLIVVGTPFNKQDYGIAIPSNSPYEEQINKALLEIKKSGLYNEILHRWSIYEDGK